MRVGDKNALLHGRPDAPARVLFRFAALLLTLLIMSFPAAPADAAAPGPLALTGPAGAEEVGRHFEYTTDPDWRLKVTDFVGASPLEMQPLPGPIPDFGYTPARIWLRLHLVNDGSSQDEWRFFAHASFTQKIAIYRVGADGQITTLLELTEDTPFSARPMDSPQLVAPFDLAPGERATLVVAYYSQGSSRISMSVETPESFSAERRLNEAKNYAFYGMMGVMITLALVALAVLRQWVFAAYAAYLASILIYIAHADGTAFQYIWPDFPRFNSMASVVGGSAGLVFGALFAITFLQTGRFHPVMHRLLQGVVVAVLAVDVVLWWADPQLLKRLLVIMISLSALTFLAAGLVAARTRFREVRFYVFAWLAALIPAILFTARFAFGLETTFITPYDAIRLALAFDALMMGLAIFDRYNHMRQIAAAETLTQAQRNLALSQRLASLEESFAQVTENARQREESMKDTVHDLRQPMHALRLSLRQILSAEADSAADVSQVESALGYMERLVAERLTDKPATNDATPEAIVAKDDGRPLRGPAAIEPGLHGVLSGIASMFEPEASAKGLELRLVLAAPDAAVAAYPLMRVVANLVSNAIKYTREGRVVIGLRRSGSGHRVEVHDTGPGLRGAVFDQALRRNQRLERDLFVAEGSGLGLSVVTEIAEANEWTVTSCGARRSGATIRVELPGASAGSPVADGRPMAFRAGRGDLDG